MPDSGSRGKEEGAKGAEWPWSYHSQPAPEHLWLQHGSATAQKQAPLGSPEAPLNYLGGPYLELHAESAGGAPAWQAPLSWPPAYMLDGQALDAPYYPKPNKEGATTGQQTHDEQDENVPPQPAWPGEQEPYSQWSDAHPPHRKPLQALDLNNQERGGPRAHHNNLHSQGEGRQAAFVDAYFSQSQLPTSAPGDLYWQAAAGPDGGEGLPGESPKQYFEPKLYRDERWEDWEGHGMPRIAKLQAANIFDWLQRNACMCSNILPLLRADQGVRLAAVMLKILSLGVGALSRLPEELKPSRILAGEAILELAANAKSYACNNQELKEHCTSITSIQSLVSQLMLPRLQNKVVTAQKRRSRMLNIMGLVRLVNKYCANCLWNISQFIQLASLEQLELAVEQTLVIFTFLWEVHAWEVSKDRYGRRHILDCQTETGIWVLIARDQVVPGKHEPLTPYEKLEKRLQEIVHACGGIPSIPGGAREDGSQKPADGANTDAEKPSGAPCGGSEHATEHESGGPTTESTSAPRAWPFQPQQKRWLPFVERPPSSPNVHRGRQRHQPCQRTTPPVQYPHLPSSQAPSQTFLPRGSSEMMLPSQAGPPQIPENYLPYGGPSTQSPQLWQIPVYQAPVQMPTPAFRQPMGIPTTAFSFSSGQWEHPPSAPFAHGWQPRGAVAWTQTGSGGSSGQLQTFEPRFSSAASPGSQVWRPLRP
ncbi:hypothetical protein, conserved [Eimeria acervulina]|uniref:Uncharacterized protein n=1 Tax=Eimeria acervulina TaxID=5801 RepID=U6GVK5_EIMAC|nr:hypothetical protein, conserved [Eimeria acervulina]CDI83602.1 hypothetical protein, conserved [Eimeria acervulina]